MNTGSVNPSARTTIVLCVLVALCEGIDLQAAGVAAPGIAAELSPAADQFGTFFSASTFGLFFGALIGGRLADSSGRKRVLAGSVALFGIFSALTPLAGNITTLAYARFLTGLGLGGALPMLLALVSETATFNRQSVSIAIVYAGTPFGGALVSLMSLMLAGSRWRWIFFIGGLLPLLLTPFLIFGLRESAAFQRAAAEVAGSTAKMPKRGSFTAIFAEGRALRTSLLWLSFFLGLLLLYLLLNWLPTLLLGDGLTRIQAAGAQIGFNIGGALAALLIGHLMEGRFRNPGIIVTFITLPILVIVLAKAPEEVALLTAIVFLLGCSVIAAQAFLYAMAPTPYPTTIRGVGVGVAVAVGRIGSIVGPKLGGTLKAAGHGPSQLLMDLVPIVLAGSCAALFLAWLARKSTPLATGRDH
jgi:MFS transporter, AAHS family, 3-hydroxyphenylpropionic acid transporter